MYRPLQWPSLVVIYLGGESASGSGGCLSLGLGSVVDSPRTHNPPDTHTHTWTHTSPDIPLHPLPLEQNDWLTGVKTLPCPKLRLWAVKSKWSCFNIVCPPPFTLTNRCKNITLPQTSFVGSKNKVIMFQYCVWIDVSSARWYNPGSQTYDNITCLDV